MVENVGIHGRGLKDQLWGVFFPPCLLPVESSYLRAHPSGFCLCWHTVSPSLEQVQGKLASRYASSYFPWFIHYSQITSQCNSSMLWHFYRAHFALCCIKIINLWPFGLNVAAIWRTIHDALAQEDSIVLLWSEANGKQKQKSGNIHED